MARDEKVRKPRDAIGASGREVGVYLLAKSVSAFLLRCSGFHFPPVHSTGHLRSYWIISLYELLGALTLHDVN
jgi:hypothetical protein